MSERETIQQRLVDHLSSNHRFWDAPYGILTGLTRLPRGGAYRSITFGVARWLDAEIRIWSPTKIEIRGEGALADKVEGEFSSVDDAIMHLMAVSS